MKKISIITLTLLSTLFFSGCGSDGSGNNTASVNTIGAGETKILAAGTTISTYSGTCAPNIVVNTDGSWTVTNPSSTSGNICQYN